ncbi:hypothetical protein GB931_00645 [Modestobacter sp. I12A-02628]|uniref:DUF6318 domain-containing protein n=1 Tax=Goekera deserti TaxID=2497753 RepID=A0A7K3WG37_9ACTN|nr:DUF6318 family protein [Goekera deserti]MPQ96453.1 hypothetical protein [Goekera deserti]NDI47232.1 hypothetical protein [Goekera deserti]NEL55367.1 hypothetical protein [Goekera deserti]
MTQRGTARAAATLLLGIALLAGCSTEQQASQTLPEPTTAEATPTLTALGPPDFPMPAEAREQTPEGAAAFTTYYIELYSRTQQTLDTQYMRALSAGCTSCDQLMSFMDGAVAQGQSLRGGETEVIAMSDPAVNGATADVAFSVDQAPLDIVDSAGNVIDGMSYAGSNNPSSGAILAWDSARSTWIMQQLDIG